MAFDLHAEFCCRSSLAAIHERIPYFTMYKLKLIFEPATWRAGPPLSIPASTRDTDIGSSFGLFQSGNRLTVTVSPLDGVTRADAADPDVRTAL